MPIRNGIRARLSNSIRKLYTRLAIDSGYYEDAEVLFHPDIFLTVSADKLVQDSGITRATTSVSSDGAKVTAIVPAGKIWRLYGISCIVDSGSFSTSEIRIQDDSAGVGIIIDAYSGTTSHGFVLPGEPFLLAEADSIRVVVSGYSSGGDLIVDVWRDELDAD